VRKTEKRRIKKISGNAANTNSSHRSMTSRVENRAARALLPNIRADAKTLWPFGRNSQDDAFKRTKEKRRGFVALTRA
jgi:hypothetical protein